MTKKKTPAPTDGPPANPGTESVATIHMTREGIAPNAADVHPDEVENFAAAGWRVGEAE